MMGQKVVLGYSVHVRAGSGWTDAATKPLCLSAACDLATQLRKAGRDAQVVRRRAVLESASRKPSGR